MLDMDCKPQRRRRQKKVSESMLLETAMYISACWKEDRLEYADDPPEKELTAILSFMRKCGIQTKEDYEDFLIKEHQTE